MIEIFNCEFGVEGHCFYKSEGRKRRFDPVKAFSVKRASYTKSNLSIKINLNNLFWVTMALSDWLTSFIDSPSLQLCAF